MTDKQNGVPLGKAETTTVRKPQRPSVLLRDHFAGVALDAMLRGPLTGGPVMMAEYSYKYADAMLKARSK